VAKRRVLLKNCPKKQIGNGLGYGESNGHMTDDVFILIFLNELTFAMR